MTLIDSFCTEHGAYNSISVPRLREHSRKLEVFAEWLGRPPETVTPEEFKQWLLDQLTEDELKPATVRKNAGFVRRFVAWCWQNGHIDADVAMRLQAIPLPRAEISQPRPYDRRELQRFWRELEEKYPRIDPKFWGRWERGTSKYKRVWTEVMLVQMHAIVALALDQGLRRQEIYDITIDDLHFENEFVVVRAGKGDKYREVPHTEASRGAIYRWLQLRTQVGCTHDRPWLTLDPRATHKSSPLHPMGYRRWSILMSQIGRGYEFHRFRHTCATEWLRAGMPIEIVKRYMGHSDIQMTLRYAEIVGADVHRAAAKAESRFARAIRPEAA